MKPIRKYKTYKPLMLMRKKNLVGPYFIKNANSTSVLSKSVGQAVESGVIVTP